MRVEPSSGGLATGIARTHERGTGRWIGWPGGPGTLTDVQQQRLARLLAERRLTGVSLSADEVRRYYEGFANRVLWPTFHYLIDRVPLEQTGWDAYRKANERFADAVIAAHEPGDLIWLQDYHLMLVPALVRERIPDARIGFFLHIPFPSSEVFRILPWRRQILQGLLGSDLIGFHTFAYMRHFVTALLHIEGIETEVDEIRLFDRQVKLGVFPMGVDVDAFEQVARDPSCVAEKERILADAAGRRILLGIDRLDYTKGIPRRLLAIERLLKNHPDLRDDIRYIQVAVPSRGGVDSYQAFRRQVEEMVGRINGTSATLRSTPIHYMYRSVSIQELTALYCAADVMLVTPLRDGMNLVSKEFVAARSDGDGVLVLSEFAGAAAELGHAISVNPYDVDAQAEAVRAALDMPAAERRRRMLAMRARVRAYDIERWVSRFLAQLESVEHRRERRRTPREEPAQRLPAALGRPLTLLLDYDGTLVPIAPTPELAAPDPELLGLLAALTSADGVSVHLISGRPREVLEEWFGALRMSMWAEHGFWCRRSSDTGWEAAAHVPPGWIDRVIPILEQFTENTPGSLIERKQASIAWHYRLADAEFGARQAHELRLLLGDALSNQPLEVLEGKKVVEVRVRGISKAIVVRGIALLDPARIVAIGDDRTDEDMFGALPDTAATIAVGSHSSRARYRLPNHRAVRAFLAAILEAGRLDPPGASG